MIKPSGATIWAYQAALTRRLLTWSLFSILAGLTMQVGGAMARATGIQFIGWGTVDAAIALFGQRQSQKRHARPDAVSAAVIAAETAKLRRLLWLNTALDVFYMTGGLVLIGRRGANDLRWRGHGLGILIQGGFLFFFDLFHALPLRKNGPTGE